MKTTWRRFQFRLAACLALAIPAAAHAQTYGNPALPYANGALPSYAPTPVVAGPTLAPPTAPAASHLINGYAPGSVGNVQTQVAPAGGAPAIHAYPTIPGTVPGGATSAYRPAPGGPIGNGSAYQGVVPTQAVIGQPIPTNGGPSYSTAQVPNVAPIPPQAYSQSPTLAPNPPVPIAVPNPVAPTAPTVTAVPNAPQYYTAQPGAPANGSAAPVYQPVQQQPAYQLPAYPQQPVYQQPPAAPQLPIPQYPYAQPQSQQPVPQHPAYAQPGMAPNYQPTFETTPQSQPAPTYVPGQPMPTGNLSPKEITPYSNYAPPSKTSTWVPRKMISLLPSAWTNQGAAPADPSMPQQPGIPNPQSPYAPQQPYAQGGWPGCGCNQTCPACDPFGGQNPCGMCCKQPVNWFENIFVFSEASAFKGPLDLDGLNGNYGKRVGAMASFPIIAKWGIGGQVGGSAGWYDYKGSLFTGDDQRFQNFTTVGMYQRLQSLGVSYGVVHDWLYDDYYGKMHFSQFRAAGAWQFNCNNELGIWAALPQGRDETFVGNPAVQNRFQSLLQGNVFWRHSLSDYAVSTIFAGLAESPSDITTGSNIQVALNKYAMLYGGFEYVLPGSGGTDGYQEEIWNLSLGMAFYPGTAKQALRSQFRPILPMPDNGNFAIWRK